MARSNDEIMTDVAAELHRQVDRFLQGDFKPNDIARWRPQMEKAIYMVEAFQSDQNLVLAKLSYNDELHAIPLGALGERMARAAVFADNWIAQRKAA